jgi:hypothetical protein
LPADLAFARGREGALASLVASVAPPPAFGAGALAWRLEAWLALLGLALAARAALARVLEPWLGAHPARTSAWIAALLLPLHPATPAALAPLAGRGELVGLALALTAVALFLRGRQAERDGFTLAGLVVFAAAGAFSAVTLGLVPLLAAAEYACVRRHRKRRLRLRTAATTGLVFGATALLARLLAPAFAGVRDVDPDSPALAMIGELGRVLVGSEVLGTSGALVAGLLTLAASAPLFRAVRNAPRLWGWVLACLALVGSAGLAWAQMDVAAPGTTRALPALLAWSAVLGLALASLARPWRAALVLALAFGWAVLTHAAARPWLRATRALARFEAEVAPLLPRDGGEVFVLDPPQIEGLASFAPELGWLFVPSEGRALDAGLDPRRLRALTTVAFLSLVRNPAFEPQRARARVVIASRAALGELEPGWRSVMLPPARPAGAEPKPWRGALTYVPDEPLDPLSFEGVRLVADLATSARELEVLGWRNGSSEAGACRGRVLERGGRRVAEFDLARSLAWTLAGSVRRLVLEKGERGIERGELVARLALLPGVEGPTLEGRDWCFPSVELAPEDAGGRFVLEVLALESLELSELVLEPARDGRLCARGAEALRRGAPLVWTLEYRIGPHALYRTRGSSP